MTAGAGRVLVVEVVDGEPVEPDLLAELGDDVEVVVLAPVGVGAATWSPLVDRLRARPELDAVAPFVPLTDAVKEIDDQGRVVADVDRSMLVTPGLPLAVRRRVVASIDAAGAEPDLGGWVASVTAEITVLGGV